MRPLLFCISVPWLAVISAAAPLLAAPPGGRAGTEAVDPFLFFLGFLLLGGIVGFFAVLAGVGGGVIFTPILMGFTAIDSYIVRTTGLFVAMTGALVASRSYIARGITNMRIVLLASVPNVAFSILGALLAGYIHDTMGAAGEALIRGMLGVVVIAIGVLFLLLGSRSDYPDCAGADSFTAALHLEKGYWEESAGRRVEYRVARAGWGILLFCLVGLASGLFGLGAGWAIVPVFNLVMLLPLKVAATCSTVMISMGSTAAVWPYLMGGGLFPLLVVPCLVGMTAGSYAGSRLMPRAKPRHIRVLIILVMFCAGIRLLLRAISMVGG